MNQTNAEAVKKQIAMLERMTVGQLRESYAEVFGEPTRSGNRQWLFRRIAWRIQMLAEGDLAVRASERAHARAKELARDADLRVRPPRGKPTRPVAAERIVSGVLAIRRDERVPPPGTVLTRTHKGREHRVAILPKGFEFAEPKRRKEVSR